MPTGPEQPLGIDSRVLDVFRKTFGYCPQFFRRCPKGLQVFTGLGLLHSSAHTQRVSNTVETLPRESYADGTLPSSNTIQTLHKGFHLIMGHRPEGLLYSLYIAQRISYNDGTYPDGPERLGHWSEGLQNRVIAQRNFYILTLPSRSSFHLRRCPKGYLYIV
jgi:hypothetical protein